MRLGARSTFCNSAVNGGALKYQRQRAELEVVKIIYRREIALTFKLDAIISS